MDHGHPDGDHSATFVMPIGGADPGAGFFKFVIMTSDADGVAALLEGQRGVVKTTYMQQTGDELGLGRVLIRDGQVWLEVCEGAFLESVCEAVEIALADARDVRIPYRS